MKNIVWVLFAIMFTIGLFLLYSNTNKNYESNFIGQKREWCETRWFDFETRFETFKVGKRQTYFQCYVKINDIWVPEGNVQLGVNKNR